MPTSHTAAMRIALISDSHLSARSPECVANWHAARRAVARLSPDVTVHLGDITLDGQSRPEELGFAAELVQRWPTEMRCLPGNHDMGDGSGEVALDEGLLSSYRHQFGPDHWHVEVDGWQLLGINAQLLGSATPPELAQWRWIEAVAAANAPGTRTALFLHRPLARVHPGDPKTSGRYVAPAARERLLEGVLNKTLRLVVSGHTHQYLDTIASGVRHVWMPSSGFVLPDEMQARVGEKLVGIGVLELNGDTMAFDLWCPDGMIRHELPNRAALPAAFADRGLAEMT
jgi:3',5'-cyclic AMP phosphodiesterase CpdA